MQNKYIKSHIILVILIQAIPVFLIYSKPFPIQFSIPSSKVIDHLPVKNRDFAFIIPWNQKTYIYDNEIDYYKGYQDSYFGITFKKAGWDCARHYEILANGSIPYFIDLDICRPENMVFLPKDLILEAMNLDGVPKLTKADLINPQNLKIDHSKFDKVKYYEILNKIMAHVKNYLTSDKMAGYVLEKIGCHLSGTVLFLSNEMKGDYLRDLTLIGLKELLKERLIDFPKIDFLYKNYSKDTSLLYGKGFSYTKILDDIPTNRTNIEERIRNKEFDFIIYGSIHRGLPFYNLVYETYPANKIAYLDGEDIWGHNHRLFYDSSCDYKNIPNLFLREHDCTQ